MSISVKDLKYDCRLFRGDIPCTPSKEHGVHCLDESGNDCKYYDRLDKDRQACALNATLSAPSKKGFTLRDGKCVPIDPAAEHKYLTGVFDDISKANTKSYQQEIFEICGFEFRGESYIMPDLHEYE